MVLVVEDVELELVELLLVIGGIRVNDAELLAGLVSTWVSLGTSVRNMLKVELVLNETLLLEAVTVACAPGASVARQP